MKVLAVCQGGNSRSVTLAYLLKKRYRIDALACGYRDNSKETLDLLFKWADKIIIMREKFKGAIPEEFKDKVLICEVGRDKYLNLSKDLLNVCETFWQDYMKGVQHG
jgi:predicted protein tyrosine phosphatase